MSALAAAVFVGMAGPAQGLKPAMMARSFGTTESRALSQEDGALPFLIREGRTGARRAPLKNRARRRSRLGHSGFSTLRQPAIDARCQVVKIVFAVEPGRI